MMCETCGYTTTRVQESAHAEIAIYWCPRCGALHQVSPNPDNREKKIINSWGSAWVNTGGKVLRCNPDTELWEPYEEADPEEKMSLHTAVCIFITVSIVGVGFAFIIKLLWES